jgi:hypothetical protein
LKNAATTRAKWKLKTQLGRKFAAILDKGKTERGLRMSASEFERELSARRGRNF